MAKNGGWLLLLAGLTPALALAQDAVAEAAKPTLNSGDTAWMLTSTALVLFMTIPGLSLFYAGMVRAKNVLSVMMQCFAITALMTVLWTIYGYSLAFDTTGMTKEAINLSTFIGGFGKAFFNGVGRDSLTCRPRQPHLGHSGNGVRHLPDDLRHHHPGADRRRVRRADEIFRPAAVHGALVHLGLRPGRAHGLERGRRADVGLGRARLCRRDRGPHQRRHRRIGGLHRAGPAQGLSHWAGARVIPPPPCRRTTSTSR